MTSSTRTGGGILLDTQTISIGGTDLLLNGTKGQNRQMKMMVRCKSISRTASQVMDGAVDHYLATLMELSA